MGVLHNTLFSPTEASHLAVTLPLRPFPRLRVCGKIPALQGDVVEDFESI